MLSHLTYLVTTDQTSDRHRAAEQHRRAAAVAEKGTRQMRESELPPMRRARSLFSVRSRPKLV